MKTLGIIGGLGPESTIAYYGQIIASYRRQHPQGDYPSVIINSVNLRYLLSLMEAQRLGAAAEYLAREVERLAKAGADFGLLSANTPHIVFDEIQRRSPIPLLSIVQATCDAAKALSVARVGLFGTRFTMQAKFYPELFSRAGINVILPDQGERDYIHEKYMSELIQGVFLAETRARLWDIALRMKERDGIEALILGGTELPLILSNEQDSPVRLLDTTKIHVERAVAMLLS